MMQRHIAGQPDVYLGRATLAITPEKALQALEDMGRRLEWDATYDFDHGRNFCVFTEGDTTFDIYREAHQAMLGGWISPREMVNARVVRRFPDGSLNQVIARAGASCLVSTVANPPRRRRVHDTGVRVYGHSASRRSSTMPARSCPTLCVRPAKTPAWCVRALPRTTSVALPWKTHRSLRAQDVGALNVSPPPPRGGGSTLLQLFKKLDAGHCELQYVLQVDPRGRIPTWASSRAVATSMFDLIKFVLRVGQE